MPKKPLDQTSQSASLDNAPPEGVARNSPFVFISHDSRDADLAAAFDNLLTDASGGVIQTFRSSDPSGKTGIEYGENWYSKIAQRLAEASDVVALLTPNSTVRPWILFEAGWAVGRLNTKVFGIALGLPLASAVSGPFAQFQNCEANEESLTGVVLQLIRRNPDARPREQAVRRQVKAFLEEIDPLIKQRTGDQPEPADGINSTTVTKLFEEVKVMFRDLSERVANERRDERRRRVHPGMIEDIFITAQREADPSTAWLLLSTLFQHEVPWLSQPALEIYRALREGSAIKTVRAQDHLRHVLKTLRKSRFPFTDPDTHLLSRLLPEMLERYSFLPSQSPEKVEGEFETESAPKASGTSAKAEEPT